MSDRLKVRVSFVRNEWKFKVNNISDRHTDTSSSRVIRQKQTNRSDMNHVSLGCFGVWWAPAAYLWHHLSQRICMSIVHLTPSGQERCCTHRLKLLHSLVRPCKSSRRQPSVYFETFLLPKRSGLVLFLSWIIVNWKHLVSGWKIDERRMYGTHFSVFLSVLCSHDKNI